ncbi:hypothetical protein [Streptomyces sp. H51]|uniref:hypothetical protein n=1 Tax=Streptomyces sp. H51 TaxID=3111770 RepID=UPI002D793706|nr:hypothetical protein [Streptomyces sp. H51]
MSDVTRPAGGTPAPAERGGGSPTGGDSGAGSGAHADAGTGTDTRSGSGAHTGTGTGAGTSVGTGADSGAGGRGEQGRASSRLLSAEECDTFSGRLQHAVAGFVDAPHDAVEEADRVLEEIAGRFAEAVTRRRRTLRASWQRQDGRAGGSAAGDTEQLRLALRDYRALAERLLHG